MSSLKLQPTRALRVIPSDNANIPFPAQVASGTTTGVLSSRLKDNNGNFLVKNVAIGDIVYNTTTLAAATVTNVIDATALNLNADIFLVAGNSYVIYQQGGRTGLGNEGCLLYIGGAGNISVSTIGDDAIVFEGVLAGTYLPVQIYKVNATGTTATLLNALW